MSTDSNKAMIAKMTNAGVPRTCWSISLRDSNRADYLEFAKGIASRNSVVDQPTTGYVHVRAEGGYLEVELLAKALVQEGAITHYVPFYKLARALRLQESAPSDEVGILDRIYGRGALVVPDVPTLTAAERHLSSMQSYREAIDWMVSHTYDGGVLVIGGLRPMGREMHTIYPPLLARLLVESSKQFGRA